MKLERNWQKFTYELIKWCWWWWNI